MSNPTFSLPPGEIRRLHHVGVSYHTLDEDNPSGEPDLFQRLREFWGALGMRCEALFAEESPDRGARGWRLYVGSIRDPVQIAYHPIIPTYISGTGDPKGVSPSAIRKHTHICFEVGPDTIWRLHEHPAFERESKWGPRHGLSSVLIMGPLGEEIEFTCSSPVDHD